MIAEITFDPTEAEYLGGGCPFDRDRHLLIETQWVDMLRRYTGNSELFTYFHRETGNMVLASWMFRPGIGKGPGLMCEIETFQCHPDWQRDQDRRPSLNFIMRRLRPVEEQINSIKKGIVESRYETSAGKEETREEIKDVAGWLRRRGQDDVARMVESGMHPYVGEREGGKERELVREALRA